VPSTDTLADCLTTFGDVVDPDSFPIRPPSLEELRAAISELRNLDLATATIDDLKDRLIVVFKGWWLSAPVFDPGLQLCRGRQLDRPAKALGEMSYSPAGAMVADGRASRAGTPLFYASAARAPILFETRATAGIKLCIIHYATTVQLPVMRIGYTPEVAQRHGSERTVPDYGIIDRDRYDEAAHLVNDFLSEVFMAQVSDDEPWRYRLSIAIAEKLLAADQVEGIMFPTAAMSANADNFALRPRFVDQHLKPVYAEYLEVTAVDGQQIRINILDEARHFGADGTIHWLGHLGQWTMPQGGRLHFEVKDGYWVARDDAGQIVDPQ
jgi:hypothetical protein